MMTHFYIFKNILNRNSYLRSLQLKSAEKLSSGLKINRSADDASGLQISEKMRSQIIGLRMASINALDGISAMQTAEGALDESHDILQRMRQLAVKAANGTLKDIDDREAIQAEINQLSHELDRISSTTEFNKQKLLDGTFKDKKLQTGANSGQNLNINLGSAGLKELELEDEMQEMRIYDWDAIKAMDPSTKFQGEPAKPAQLITSYVIQPVTGKPGQTQTIEISVDGKSHNIQLNVGDSADDIVRKISDSLGSSAKVELDSGRLKITTTSTGQNSTVSIIRPQINDTSGGIPAGNQVATGKDGVPGIAGEGFIAKVELNNVGSNGYQEIQIIVDKDLQTQAQFKVRLNSTDTTAQILEKIKKATTVDAGGQTIKITDVIESMALTKDPSTGKTLLSMKTKSKEANSSISINRIPVSTLTNPITGAVSASGNLADNAHINIDLTDVTGSGYQEIDLTIDNNTKKIKIAGGTSAIDAYKAIENAVKSIGGTITYTTTTAGVNARISSGRVGMDSYVSLEKVVNNSAGGLSISTILQDSGQTQVAGQEASSGMVAIDTDALENNSPGYELLNIQVTNSVQTSPNTFETKTYNFQDIYIASNANKSEILAAIKEARDANGIKLSDVATVSIGDASKYNGIYDGKLLIESKTQNGNSKVNLTISPAKGVDETNSVTGSAPTSATLELSLRATSGRYQDVNIEIDGTTTSVRIEGTADEIGRQIVDAIRAKMGTKSDGTDYASYDSNTKKLTLTSDEAGTSSTISVQRVNSPQTTGGIQIPSGDYTTKGQESQYATLEDVSVSKVTSGEQSYTIKIGNNKYSGVLNTANTATSTSLKTAIESLTCNGKALSEEAIVTVVEKTDGYVISLTSKNYIENQQIILSVNGPSSGGLAGVSHVSVKGEDATTAVLTTAISKLQGQSGQKEYTVTINGDTTNQKKVVISPNQTVDQIAQSFKDALSGLAEVTLDATKTNLIITSKAPGANSKVQVSAPTVINNLEGGVVSGTVTQQGKSQVKASLTTDSAVEKISGEATQDVEIDYDGKTYKTSIDKNTADIATAISKAKTDGGELLSSVADVDIDPSSGKLNITAKTAKEGASFAIRASKLDVAGGISGSTISNIKDGIDATSATYTTSILGTPTGTSGQYKYNIQIDGTYNFEVIANAGTDVTTLVSLMNDSNVKDINGTGKSLSDVANIYTNSPDDDIITFTSRQAGKNSHVSVTTEVVSELTGGVTNGLHRVSGITPVDSEPAKIAANIQPITGDGIQRIRVTVDGSEQLFEFTSKDTVDAMVQRLNDNLSGASAFIGTNADVLAGRIDSSQIGMLHIQTDSTTVDSSIKLEVIPQNSTGGVSDSSSTNATKAQVDLVWKDITSAVPDYTGELTYKITINEGTAHEKTIDLVLEKRSDGTSTTINEAASQINASLNGMGTASVSGNILTIKSNLASVDSSVRIEQQSSNAIGGIVKNTSEPLSYGDAQIDAVTELKFTNIDADIGQSVDYTITLNKGTIYETHFTVSAVSETNPYLTKKDVVDAINNYATSVANIENDPSKPSTYGDDQIRRVSAQETSDGFRLIYKAHDMIDADPTIEIQQLQPAPLVSGEGMGARKAKIEVGVIPTAGTGPTNLSVTVDGVTKQLESFTSGLSPQLDVEQYRAALQNKIDKAFGAGKVKVDYKLDSNGQKVRYSRITWGRYMEDGYVLTLESQNTTLKSQISIDRGDYKGFDRAGGIDWNTHISDKSRSTNYTDASPASIAMQYTEFSYSNGDVVITIDGQKRLVNFRGITTYDGVINKLKAELGDIADVIAVQGGRTGNIHIPEKTSDYVKIISKTVGESSVIDITNIDSNNHFISKGFDSKVPPSVTTSINPLGPYKEQRTTITIDGEAFAINIRSGADGLTKDEVVQQINDVIHSKGVASISADGQMVISSLTNDAPIYKDGEIIGGTSSVSISVPTSASIDPNQGMTLISSTDGFQGTSGTMTDSDVYKPVEKAALTGTVSIATTKDMVPDIVEDGNANLTFDYIIGSNYSAGMTKEQKIAQNITQLLNTKSKEKPNIRLKDVANVTIGPDGKLTISTKSKGSTSAVTFSSDSDTKLTGGVSDASTVSASSVKFTDQNHTDTTHNVQIKLEDVQAVSSADKDDIQVFNLIYKNSIDPSKDSIQQIELKVGDTVQQILDKISQNLSGMPVDARIQDGDLILSLTEGGNQHSLEIVKLTNPSKGFTQNLQDLNGVDEVIGRSASITTTSAIQPLENVGTQTLRINIDGTDFVVDLSPQDVTQDLDNDGILSADEILAVINDKISSKGVASLGSDNRLTITTISQSASSSVDMSIDASHKISGGLNQTIDSNLDSNGKVVTDSTRGHATMENVATVSADGHQELKITVDDDAPTTIRLGAGFTIDQIRDAINVELSGRAVATISGNNITITSNKEGQGSSIKIEKIAGSGGIAQGFTATNGQNARPEVWTSNEKITQLSGHGIQTLIINIDGHQTSVELSATVADPVTPDEIAGQINSQISGLGNAIITSDGRLQITSQSSLDESSISVNVLTPTGLSGGVAQGESTTDESNNQVKDASTTYVRLKDVTDIVGALADSKQYIKVAIDNATTGDLIQKTIEIVPKADGSLSIGEIAQQINDALNSKGTAIIDPNDPNDILIYANDPGAGSKVTYSYVSTSGGFLQGASGTVTGKEGKPTVASLPISTVSGAEQQIGIKIGTNDEISIELPAGSTLVELEKIINDSLVDSSGNKIATASISGGLLRITSTKNEDIPITIRVKPALQSTGGVSDTIGVVGTAKGTTGSVPTASLDYSALLDNKEMIVTVDGVSRTISLVDETNPKNTAEISTLVDRINQAFSANIASADTATGKITLKSPTNTNHSSVGYQTLKNSSPSISDLVLSSAAESTGTTKIDAKPEESASVLLKNGSDIEDITGGAGDSQLMRVTVNGKAYDIKLVIAAGNSRLNVYNPANHSDVNTIAGQINAQLSGKGATAKWDATKNGIVISTDDTGDATTISVEKIETNNARGGLKPDSSFDRGENATKPVLTTTLTQMTGTGTQDITVSIDGKDYTATLSSSDTKADVAEKIKKAVGIAATVSYDPASDELVIRSNGGVGTSGKINISTTKNDATGGLSPNAQVITTPAVLPQAYVPAEPAKLVINNVSAVSGTGTQNFKLTIDSNTYEITLNAGMTKGDIVDKINSVIKSDGFAYLDSTGNNLVVQTTSNGRNSIAKIEKLPQDELTNWAQGGILVGNLKATGVKSIPGAGEKDVQWIGINVLTQENASKSITQVTKSVDIVSRQRANIGAIQNRLEATIRSLDNSAENTTAAEMRLRDTDIAKEMAKKIKYEIIMQAQMLMFIHTKEDADRAYAMIYPES